MRHRSRSTAILLFLPAVLLAQRPDPAALDALWARQFGKIEPAPTCVQLRRLSLQLRDTIPAEAEARDCEKFDRRARAEAYLKSPEFAEAYSMRIGSMLRDRSRQDGAPFAAYQKYISAALHTNKPYDRFVYELLTAKGSPTENGATIFFLRDDSDPLELAEYAGRAFYGRRYSCARCHDHPYMEFSRRDYYGMAAFFSQTWIKRSKEEFMPGPRREHMSKQDQEAYRQKEGEWRQSVWNPMSDAQKQAWREQNKLAYREVVFEPALGLRFPYSDQAPGGDMVKPRLPDGQKPLLEDGEDRRVVFARWLTDPANSRFRKVFINRIWTDLMGWSFFTPLDDWDPAHKIAAEPMLGHLDQVFLAYGQRPKDLVYYIVSSNAWARRTARKGDTEAEASFQPRRLTGDQLFNSLVTALKADKMRLSGERAASLPGTSPAAFSLAGTGAVRLPQEKQNEFARACEIPRPAASGTFLGVFGSGERNDIDDDVKELNISQVLTLYNGNTTRQVVGRAVQKDSLLGQEFARHGDMQRIYEQIYVQFLSRPMSNPEKTRWQTLSLNLGPKRPEFDRAATEDLIWALIQSQEFLHVY